VCLEEALLIHWDATRLEPQVLVGLAWGSNRSNQARRDLAINTLEIPSFTYLGVRFVFSFNLPPCGSKWEMPSLKKDKLSPNGSCWLSLQPITTSPSTQLRTYHGVSEAGGSHSNMHESLINKSI
jgi:hypothetical protein